MAGDLVLRVDVQDVGELDRSGTTFGGSVDLVLLEKVSLEGLLSARNVARSAACAAEGCARPG